MPNQYGNAIRRINPEWADIGALKATVDSNWSEGVAATKEIWQGLLSNVSGTIGSFPTPPKWVWGLGRLRAAKDDVLGDIAQIQQISNQALDEAMAIIKDEVDRVLDELGRIVRGSDDGLVPAGAGGVSPNRMEAEPPVSGEPLRMQSQGNPGQTNQQQTHSSPQQANSNIPNGINVNQLQINPNRQTHILDGDATGGGHGPGRGIPGKSEFPQRWSDSDTLNNISDVVRDPNSVWTQQSGRPGARFTRNGDPVRWKIEGTRDNVDIRVIVEPDGQGVITAFPTNIPRNP